MTLLTRICYRRRLNYQQICYISSIKTSKEKDIQLSPEAQYDLIGQPDKHSNLRPVKIYVAPDETPLQRQYRELRLGTEKWNQKFWSEHNQKFIKERERFVSATKKDGETSLSADNMSIFYKDFLDSNWNSHVSYNVEWYGRNIKILGFALRVKLENMWNKLMRK